MNTMKIFMNPKVWVGIPVVGAVMIGLFLWSSTSSQRCALGNSLLCESLFNTISHQNSSLKGSYYHSKQGETVLEVMWQIDKEGHELIRTQEEGGGEADIIIAGESAYLSRRGVGGYWKVSAESIMAYQSSFPFHPSQWIKSTLTPLQNEGRIISQDLSKCSYGKCSLYTVQLSQSNELTLEVDERMKTIRAVSGESDGSVYEVKIKHETNTSVIPKREVMPAQADSTVIPDFFLRRDVKESKTPAYVKEFKQQQIEFEKQP